MIAIGLGKLEMAKKMVKNSKPLSNSKGLNTGSVPSYIPPTPTMTSIEQYRKNRLKTGLGAGRDYTSQA